VPLEEVKALANVPMPPTGEHVIVRQRNARHPRHALAAAVFRRIRSGVIAALVVVIGRRGGLAQ